LRRITKYWITHWIALPALQSFFTTNCVDKLNRDPTPVGSRFTLLMTRDCGFQNRDRGRSYLWFFRRHKGVVHVPMRQMPPQTSVSKTTLRMQSASAVS
jgi:hypothetical protein